MAGNKVKCYLDVVEHHPDWTIEEFEEEEKKLKEESDKLKEWPELIQDQSLGQQQALFRDRFKFCVNSKN